MFGNKTPTRSLGDAHPALLCFFSGLIISSCPCKSQNDQDGDALGTYTPYKPLSHFQRDPDWPCLYRFIPEPITEARKIKSSDWSCQAVGVIPGPGTFGGRPLGLQACTRSLLPVNSNTQSPRKITLPGPWSAGGHRGPG